MMKNKIIPVSISENDWLSPNEVDISPAPLSRKMIKKLVNIIVIGLNLASHDTITAVKPWPELMVVVMVWLIPPTRIQPAKPQSAPERIMVRMIIFSVFIPTYFAVFSLSPTTAISYPCLEYLRYTNIDAVTTAATTMGNKYFCPKS